MPDTDKTVFISYRRSVSSYIARAVFMDLRAHGYDAFMDVESIDSGTFDTIILNQIAARAHFVVILAPGSMERCTEPGDWLRREIEHAMDLQRNIVPVLADDFSFKGAEPYLPGKLSQLKRYSGLTVPHEYFEEAMDKLRNRFLRQPIYGQVRPTPATERTAVQRKIKKAASKPMPSGKQLSAMEYYSRGLEKYKKGDWQAAISESAEAIRLNSRFSEAHGLRGLARKEKGDLDGALRDYTRSIELNNPEPDIPYMGRGIVRYKKGDLDGAIADFSKAIHHNPQNLNALLWRGVTHRGKGNVDEAIADFDQAIALKPDNAEVYNGRGIAYRHKGDLERAISDYNQAIALKPDYVDAYYNRGFAYAERGDLKRAIADYRRVLKMTHDPTWRQRAEERLRELGENP